MTGESSQRLAELTMFSYRSPCHFSKSNVMTLQVIDELVHGKKEHQSWVCSLKWTRRDNGKVLLAFLTWVHVML